MGEVGVVIVFIENLYDFRFLLDGIDFCSCSNLMNGKEFLIGGIG